MIDASIPLSGGNRPDPIREIFSQIQEHKLGQLKQQMYEQQLAQSQRAQEEDAQLKQLLAGGAQGQDLVAQLTGAGHLDKANALQKQLNEQESFKLERQTKIGGLMKNLTGQVLSNPTEQSAIAALDHFQRVTGENVDNEKALVYSMRNNPEGIMKWAAGHSLNADQLLPKVETKDLGGTLQTQQIDPITGQVKVTGSQAKSMTPGEVASNEVARGNLAVNQANLGISRERLALDREKASNESVAQKKLDMKIEQDAKKAKLREEQNLSKADLVISKADEALKKTGMFTSGFTGKMLSNVAGTPAYDLDKTIDTIKANIGFNELAAMREASPTGGALGQIAVKELDFLQAALSSLDVGQSEKQQRANLESVKKHYENWKKTLSGEMPQQNRVETDSLPDPAQYKGKRMTDTSSGDSYVSNGSKWIRQK